MSERKAKKNPPHRVHAGMVPKQRAWMLDEDYWASLPPEAQRYLAQFNDEYYRADYRYAEPMHDTQELERDRYGMQNANARDIYSLKQAAGELVFGIPPDRREASEVDMLPLPRFLRDEDYRIAVDEMRRLIDIPKRTEVEQDRLLMLQEFINSITGGSTEDDDE